MMDSTAHSADAGPATAQSPREREVAQLIVDTLHLEDKPADILPEAALFGDALGLNSIDALEISLAISKTYGVELKSDDARNPEIFSCLRSLTAFIESARTR